MLKPDWTADGRTGSVRLVNLLLLLLLPRAATAAQQHSERVLTAPQDRCLQHSSHPKLNIHLLKPAAWVHKVAQCCDSVT